jgi:hypothetical protein
LSLDDIDNLQKAVEKQIYSIRKTIESNIDHDLSGELRANILTRILVYLNLTIRNFEKINRHNREAHETFNQNPKNENAIACLLSLEKCYFYDFLGLLREVIDALLEVLIDYFPEICLKDNNIKIFEKYLSKYHPFRATIQKKKNEPAIEFAPKASKKQQHIPEKRKFNDNSWAFFWNIMCEQEGKDKITLSNYLRIIKEEYKIELGDKSGINYYNKFLLYPDRISRRTSATLPQTVKKYYNEAIEILRIYGAKSETISFIIKERDDYLGGVNCQ